MARTSMFSGNEVMRSTKDRRRSKPRAWSLERALSSCTSVENRDVTSITTESSSPSAAMLKTIRIVSVLAASTACAIREGFFGHHVVGDVAEQDAVVTTDPFYDPRIDLPSTVTLAGARSWRFGQPTGTPVRVPQPEFS